MPVMIDIKRAVVFGGERGEGLQKTQKLAVFAGELLVVPESPWPAAALELPAGVGSELKEHLALGQPRSVPVHPRTASEVALAQAAREAALTPDGSPGPLDNLVRGASWVVSDLTDRSLNETIAAACARAGALCTVVDTKDLSNAWFMSLIMTPHLLAGLSTGGRAAFYTARLREKLEPQFDRFEAEAAILAEIRSRLPRGEAAAVLARIWDDARFHDLLAAGDAEHDTAARARAAELAWGEGAH